MRRPSPQVARKWSRALLLVGAEVVVATVLLIVMRPTFVGDPHFADRMQIPDEIPLGMAVLGLACMVRMYRWDPEAGPSPWRFHEWD
jgi:hypothetical protein